LVLAAAGKPDQVYTIKACIALSELRVEEVDNGRGEINTLTLPAVKSF